MFPYVARNHLRDTPVTQLDHLALTPRRATGAQVQAGAADVQVRGVECAAHQSLLPARAPANTIAAASMAVQQKTSVSNLLSASTIACASGLIAFVSFVITKHPFSNYRTTALRQNPCAKHSRRITHRSFKALIVPTTEIGPPFAPTPAAVSPRTSYRGRSR